LCSTISHKHRPSTQNDRCTTEQVKTKLAGAPYNSVIARDHHFRIGAASIKDCQYWAEKYTGCKDLESNMDDEGLEETDESSSEDSSDSSDTSDCAADVVMGSDDEEAFDNMPLRKKK
jgi:hypothetical protein